jgi:hypothetical protein
VTGLGVCANAASDIAATAIKGGRTAKRIGMAATPLSPAILHEHSY